MADSQRCRKAQQAAQAEEEVLKEAGTSQPEVPAHGEPPGIQIGGGDKSLPMKTVPDRERILKTTREILGHLHALHLQTMHEMGSMWEVDWTLAQTLMAEFVRLQLIVGEDVTKSLLALRSDLEASCEVLVSDIVRTIDLHPNDPVACQVKAVLQTFQQSTSMKVTLPLMELEAARGDMEEFMQSPLRELSSQTESRELIGALSQKLANHTSWVQVPELMEEEVALRVIIGLGAHLLLEGYPGILEGLSRRLGLAPPGVLNPPTSVQEGVAHHWAATLRESIRRTEGRDIDLGQVMSTVVPHGLHLDYDLDFQNRKVDDVAPILTSPLLSGLIGNLNQFERPGIPGEPTSFKADENLWGLGGAPPKPDLPSPSHDKGIASKRPASEGEAQRTEPPGQGESNQDQPPMESEQDDITEIVILGDDESTIQEPQGSSTPRSEPDQCQKRSPEDQSPHPLPPKKLATREEEKSMPQ